MTAAGHWRRQLEAWAIPDELLDRVDESPYGWSQELWKRRSAMAQDRGQPPTTAIVENLLAGSGTVLDIGIGRGRASLPLAAAGHRLIGVDESADMLEGLGEEAAEIGVTVEAHQGRWPDVAASMPAVDVVMAVNVAYNVQDIEPFLGAAFDHARTGVVLEVTDAHPWAHLAPLYREVHGLDRPTGPTADDLADVIREMTGQAPEVHRWERSGQVWFESWEELMDHYGRRLVVPAGERHRLRPILEPRVSTDAEGHLRVGDEPTAFTTLVTSTRAQQ